MRDLGGRGTVAASVAVAVSIATAQSGSQALLRGHSTDWNLAHHHHVWRLHSPFSRAPASHPGRVWARQTDAYATALHPRVEPVDIADLAMMGPLALRRAVDAATHALPANSYPLLVFSYADLADVCDATLCLLTGAADRPSAAAANGGRSQSRGGGRSPTPSSSNGSPSLNESTNPNPARTRGAFRGAPRHLWGAGDAAAGRPQCVLLFVPRVCAAEVVEDLARQNDLARAAVAQAQARRRSRAAPVTNFGAEGGRGSKGGGGGGGGGLSFGVRSSSRPKAGAPSERLMDELDHPGWSYRYVVETVRQLRTVHNHPVIFFGV